MKIAILDYTCSSRDYDHHLCEGLARNGHEVVLFGRPLRDNENVSPEKYIYKDLFFRFGERVRSFGMPRNIRRLAKGFEYIAQLKNYARQLKKFGPDIINFQWLFFPLVDRYFIRRLSRIAPLVLTVHDSRVNFKGELPWLMYKGWAAIANRFNGIIAMSKHGKERLIRNGVLPDKIRLVPLGLIDFGVGKAAAEINWLSNEGKVALFFGMVTHDKKLDLLLKAFAGMKTRLRETTILCIAGKADKSIKMLKRLASQLGIASRIHWHQRFIPDNEIPQMFARADIVVYPFKGVDGSRSLMASLPYGKPTVFSDGGGISEILREGIHGIAFKEGDSASFSNALEEILDDRTDRLRMGEAVKKLNSEIPTWDEIARKTAAIYDKCISRRAP